MERYGFRELTIFEERLTKNGIYFARIKNIVIFLALVILAAISLLSVQAICFPKAVASAAGKTLYCVCIVALICSTLFLYLKLRNGRYAFINSYATRLNRVLEQFSLQYSPEEGITFGGGAAFEVNPVAAACCNYNLNQYKLEFKQRKSTASTSNGNQ
jgi:hypothetical protein